MTVEFDTRQDDYGWTVFDLQTGHAVVVGRARQSGLSFVDADDLAHRLNHRRLAGGRSILR